jgi:hypothetical protein
MFATIRVDNWDEACAIGASLQRWGFRGQSDEAWEPESTLLRARELYGCKPVWTNHREYWMLRQFQRRFSAYVGTIPTPASKLDWLAVMQHYGSATRLVDFSHSFYVAAFFAVERAANDAAIWAISQNLIMSLPQPGSSSEPQVPQAGCHRQRGRRGHGNQWNPVPEGAFVV